MNKNCRTPVEEAERIFDRYAAMDSPELPTGLYNLSALQVKLHRWQVTNFGAQESWKMYVGAAEEMGELARALLKSSQGIRGYDDTRKFREAAGDAIADVLVYLTQLATALRMDIGKLFVDTSHMVMERNWKDNPVDADTKSYAQKKAEAIYDAENSNSQRLLTKEELDEINREQLMNARKSVSARGCFREWMQIGRWRFDEHFDANDLDEDELAECAHAAGLHSIPIGEEPADFLNRYIHELVLVGNDDEYEEEEEDGEEIEPVDEVLQYPNEAILEAFRRRNLLHGLNRFDWEKIRQISEDLNRFQWVGNETGGYWVMAQYVKEMGQEGWCYRLFKDIAGKPIADTGNRITGFTNAGAAMEGGVESAKRNCINHSIKIDPECTGPVRTVTRPYDLGWGTK